MFTFLTPIKRVWIVSLMVLITIQVAACGVGAPTTEPAQTPTLAQDLSAPTQSPSSQDLSTPELIDQAFARGEITEEERLLYLAYALYEPQSLPAQFRSNYGWFGEVAAEELDEAVGSPARLCSMNPHIRSELLRLVKKKMDDTVCN